MEVEGYGMYDANEGDQVALWLDRALFTNYQISVLVLMLVTLTPPLLSAFLTLVQTQRSALSTQNSITTPRL